MHFLEQTFQSVSELHPITRQLEFAPGHTAPETLRHIGDETQGQFVRDQAFHQPFRIGKILLPAAWSMVRLRLRQMQGARGRCGVGSQAPDRLPVTFQRLPHRPPIQRRGFHHHFLDVALDEPGGQPLQLTRAGPELSPLKFPVPIDINVRDRHGQHPLVHVHSCDPIWHTPSQA